MSRERSEESMRRAIELTARDIREASARGGRPMSEAEARAKAQRIAERSDRDRAERRRK